MAEGIAPLVLEIRARASELFTEVGKVKAEVGKMAAETEGHTGKAKAAFEGMAGAGKAMAVGIVGSAALVGGAALKMGMDFQESMTTLVTGAGESEDNIKKVGDGILNMAGKVGMSSDQLAKGMYLIESAGYHGSQGLNVLKAAAEGARVGNADMKTVADGLTTALTDYHLPASRAADVTSKLVETVASGKTTMGDLAGSLATVLPIASTAKVGLDQVLGAMATMTAKGTPAADAATYLKQTIAQLSNPTSKAAGEMKALGLSSIDVSQNLGKRGLTGTMDLLTSAIASKMGPQGTVLIDTLKKAAKSSGGLQSAISKLPPAQQTYVAALADMVGGTKSMQAALMLTGDSAQTFKDNVHNIGKASTEAGGHVQGFGATQKDLKTQLENAKAGVEALVTKLGLALIPIVEKVIGVATKWGSWLTDHKAVLYAVAGIIGTVMVVAIGAYIAKLVVATAQHIASFAKMLAATVEWVVKSAAQFAVWIAQGVAAFATWVARQAASIAESVALWAMYFAEWIAKQAAALAESTATMVAGMAEWVAAQAAGFAQAVAGAAVWIAEHVAMAAAAVVQYGIMAAAATAAFVAENAATLGIVGAIGLIVAGIAWLATHWGEAWDAIKAAAKWAYDNVIKPVADWIMNNVIHPIGSAISWLGDVWGKIWGAIGGVVRAGAAVIEGAIGGIVGAISTVVGWIKTAIGWFENLFSSANSANTASQRAAASGAAAARTAAINMGSGTILGNLSQAHFPSHDVGGWIDAPRGAPQLGVNHGGEYMLSLDMLAGRQKIDPSVAAAIAAQGAPSAPPSSTARGPGGGQTINVYAQTNADPHRIAAEIGWVQRAMA